MKVMQIPDMECARKMAEVAYNKFGINYIDLINQWQSLDLIDIGEVNNVVPINLEDIIKKSIDENFDRMLENTILQPKK